jgi:magnesium chelatase family protein
MRNVFDRLGMSARAHGKILKVARTIADMDRSEEIRPVHLTEAIQYRSLDRRIWNI